MIHTTARFRAAVAFLTFLRLAINTAQRLVYPFLPAIARGLGISLEQAGLLVSARWVAGFVTPAVVSVAGRGERRRRVVALGLALFTTGAAVTAAFNVYIGALAGFLLMGVAKPVFDVAAQAYIADHVPYESRARFVGLFEITWAGALLVGAPAAGWLIDRLGWNAPFWVLAAVTAAGFAALSSVVAGDGGESSGHPPVRLELDRIAAAFLIVVALFAAGGEVIFVALGAWLEGSFGLSLLALGGLATLVGLAELIGEGGVAAFADKFGKRASMATGLLIAAAGFGLLAVTHDSVVLGIGSTMVGFLGFEVTIVSAIPYATEVRPRARARFLAWMVVAMSAGRTVGAAVGAVSFARLGLTANALIAVGVNLAAFWVLVGSVRRRKHPATGVHPTI